MPRIAPTLGIRQLRAPVAYAGELGGVQTSPLRTGKIVIEKWCYFQRPYFGNNISQKYIEIQFFYWIFIKTFQNFLENFPTSCVFRLNARKFNAGVLNFLEK